MFQYEKTPEGYWIWSDKIAGKFGPFSGIYIKNIFFGDFPSTFETSKYPAYKFALGKGNENIFVLTLAGCEDLISSLSEIQK